MFGPDTIWVVIPGLALMIPIVALMQHHQRQMAEIIHGGRYKEAVQGELEEMRSEITQLRTQIATQALALEGLAKRKGLPEANDTDSLAQRLG